ncbi:hypothetical protein DENSPDRAFT_524615 [Dentipellis sp. KUC8613]|nr:hypothetical protein DENSPDRAFT_524615 [Dentipellis sp. KUC8613]
MLHPSYDPHHDQYSAALESAFPHLHTPQIGRTAPVTGEFAYQGYTPANLATNFPHSSYSELANYAGDCRPADNAPGATQAAVAPGKLATPSSTHHGHMSECRASIAAPSAKGQKRKSRKGATDVSVVPRSEPLGGESNEERARKNKKARQQRDYRARDKGIVDELEDILPDGYKTNDPRAIRKKVARDLTEKNSRLEDTVKRYKTLLQDAENRYDCLYSKYNLTRNENKKLHRTIHTLEGGMRGLESGRL